jgi:hypothetical protein
MCAHTSSAPRDAAAEVFSKRHSQLWIKWGCQTGMHDVILRHILAGCSLWHAGQP